MSEKLKIIHCRNIRKLVERLRDDLSSQDFVLLYAYNGTGKTRLSMEFKEAGKRKRGIARDTLYFNAYTEDLFHWDNDLENNTERVLQINSVLKNWR
jgi:tRNA A37 threonylcarbamoyladenosine biosynthesis protein TsaE